MYIALPLGAALSSCAEGKTVCVLYSSYNLSDGPSSASETKISLYLVDFELAVVRFSPLLHSRRCQSSSAFALKLDHDARQRLFSRNRQHDLAGDQIEVSEDGIASIESKVD